MTETAKQMPPVKLGLIGLGFAGTRLHLSPLLQNPRAQLVHVADIDSAKVQAFKAAHSQLNVAASDDWQAVINNKEVEAVFVCTPTPTHRQIAEAALAAGKHVFLEKPIALNVEDAQALQSRLRQHPTQLVMVGQVLRFWDEYVKAHWLVKHGRIGQPCIARASRAVAMPSGWYAREEMSGGVIVDLSLHDIDFLVWTLGEVESVFAQGTDCRGGRDEGFVDYVQTQLNFKSGAVAHVEAIWATAAQFPFTTSLEICGTAGMLSFDNSAYLSSLEWCRDDQATVRSSPTEFNAYFHEDDQFLKAVQTHSVLPPVTVEDVVHPLQVVLAAKESIKTGEIVQVAPNKQTIGVGR
jgi:predicted dehydrogenase